MYIYIYISLIQYIYIYQIRFRGFSEAVAHLTQLENLELRVIGLPELHSAEDLGRGLKKLQFAPTCKSIVTHSAINVIDINNTRRV